MTGGTISIEIESPPIPIYWSISVTELEQLLQYTSSNPLLQMTIQQMIVNKNAGWEVYTISLNMVSQVIKTYNTITNHSHVHVNPSVLVTETVQSVVPGVEPVKPSHAFVTATELPTFVTAEDPNTTSNVASTEGTEIPTFVTTEATEPTATKIPTFVATEDPSTTSKVASTEATESPAPEIINGASEQTCLFSNDQVDKMKGNTIFDIKNLYN